MKFNKTKVLSTAVMITFMLSMISLGASNVVAQDANQIGVNFPLTFETYSARSWESVGFYYQQALAPLGIDVQIIIKPWARAYADASNIKNVLLFSVARMEERENDLTWIFKILTVENKIYTLSSNKPNQEISLDELKQSKIAVVKNGMNDNYLRKNNFQELVYINDLNHSVELLQRNRLDYFASSVVGFYQHIKKNK